MVPPPSTHGTAHNQGVKPSIGCLDDFQEFPSDTPTKNKRFSSYSTNISEAKSKTNVSSFVIDEFYYKHVDLLSDELAKFVDVYSDESVNRGSH